MPMCARQCQFLQICTNAIFSLFQINSQVSSVCDWCVYFAAFGAPWGQGLPQLPHPHRQGCADVKAVCGGHRRKRQIAGREKRRSSRGWRLTSREISQQGSNATTAAHPGGVSETKPLEKKNETPQVTSDHYACLIACSGLCEPFN